MLKKLKTDIDTALWAFLDTTKGDFALKPLSPLLHSGINDFLKRGGKRIRPILFFLSYRGYTDRKVSYKKLLRCSLSLELMHDFFLVHDDVIDNSDLRRGKPTLHRVFNKKLGLSLNDVTGSNLSIAAGDIIFAMAVQTLLSFDEDKTRKEHAMSEFLKAAAHTGAGEFMDVVNGIQNITKITEKDVFQTYTLKTATYTFECPLLTGAKLAGVSPSEIRNLSRFSILTGQAFQIQDDLLDIFSSSSKIGKSILSDLGESKKTLLVWKAYKTLKKDDKKALKHLLEKDTKTYSDLIKFRKLIKISGAHKYCLEKIDLLMDEADSICARLTIKKKYKKELQELIKKLLSPKDSLNFTK